MAHHGAERAPATDVRADSSSALERLNYVTLNDRRYVAVARTAGRYRTHGRGGFVEEQDTLEGYRGGSGHDERYYHASTRA